MFKETITYLNIFTPSRSLLSHVKKSYVLDTALCTTEIIGSSLILYLVQFKSQHSFLLDPLQICFVSLLPLFCKNKSRPMTSPSFLCVYESPLSTFGSLNQSSWNLVSASRHLSPSQRLASLIPPMNLRACMLISFLLLDNDAVKLLLRQRIHATIEGLLEESISMRSVS